MIPYSDIEESDYRLIRRIRSMSPEETAVRNALAEVNADTGVEKALSIIQSATPATSYSVAPVPVQNPFPSAPVVPTIVYATPPAPAPTITPTSNVVKTITNPIKTATPDIVLFDDAAVPVEVMTDLIFENIGGQELINISRSDTINGQKIKYQPIKNINSINQEYNPNNILGLQKTSDKFFAGFSIKFENKIPNISNSEDNNPVYIDDSGHLVVDSINLNNDEQVEIEIALSGTIYEAEI